MDGFDTMAMSYLADPMPVGFLPHTDYLQSTSGLDMQDHLSNFDSETYMSADDLTFGASNSLGHPALKRFPSSYDDPFADANMSQFEQGLPEQTGPESPSLDGENKLLGFSMPLYHFTLLDCSLRRTSLNMAAQLHGMFFLAESQWPANPDAPPPPPELTCYRRNLFQITGSVRLPRTLRYIMTDQGDRIPILAQELTVSATESVEGNPVKLISVPWKTPAGGAPTTTEDRAEKEPPSIPLDTMGRSDLDADCATFPIQWKRLQFRIATANNGRRKELQQHFVIRLKILATLSTGGQIPLAEAQSGAIVVRGRSPRNFQSRKDLPLSNSAAASRKTLGAGISRTSTGDSEPQALQSKPAVSPDEVPQVVFQQYENNDLPSTTPELIEWNRMTHSTIPETLATPDYHHNNNSSMLPPQIPSYTNPSQPEGSPLMPLTNRNISALNAPVSLSFSSDEETSPVPRTSKPALSRPPTSNPSPSLPNSQKSRSAPIPSPPPPSLQNLPKQGPRLNTQQRSSSASSGLNQQSITTTTNSDDNNNNTITTTATKPRPNSDTSRQPSSKSTGGQSVTSIHPARSNQPTKGGDGAAAAVAAEETDAADMLYEYFPLGLDDWMPPVDAVYRPHVVHHTGPLRKDALAGDGVAMAGGRTLGRASNKRYFSGDD